MSDILHRLPLNTADWALNLTCELVSPLEAPFCCFCTEVLHSSLPRVHRGSSGNRLEHEQFLEPYRVQSIVVWWLCVYMTHSRLLTLLSALIRSQRLCYLSSKSAVHRRKDTHLGMFCLANYFTVVMFWCKCFLGTVKASWDSVHPVHTSVYLCDSVEYFYLFIM